MTKTDTKKLATFDRLNARLSKYQTAKNWDEAKLVAADRTMHRMAEIRDTATPALRKKLKNRGWS